LIISKSNSSLIFRLSGRTGILPYHHDTYDRRIQLGASRERRKDAEALHSAGRWTGAMYLAGYAIECSLKSLICFMEAKSSFRDTRIFRSGSHNATLHNLSHLLEYLPVLQRAISLDRTGVYKNAWNTITSMWQKDELRYWNKLEDESRCKRFIEAVKVMHQFILSHQGETS